MTLSPEGGASKICLSLWERWHAVGVTERVFRGEPTHPQTPIYTHPRSASRKITAVGEGLRPFGDRMPQELPRRTVKPHESPCFCARAPKSRGIQAYLIGSAHLRLKSANAPSLRRIPKEPAPQSRFLRAAFFPSAFFAEAKKADPQTQTIQPKHHLE